MLVQKGSAQFLMNVNVNIQLESVGDAYRNFKFGNIWVWRRVE